FRTAIVNVLFLDSSSQSLQTVILQAVRRAIHVLYAAKSSTDEALAIGFRHRFPPSPTKHHIVGYLECHRQNSISQAFLRAAAKRIHKRRAYIIRGFVPTKDSRGTIARGPSGKTDRLILRDEA